MLTHCWKLSVCLLPVLLSLTSAPRAQATQVYKLPLAKLISTTQPDLPAPNEWIRLTLKDRQATVLHTTAPDFLGTIWKDHPVDEVFWCKVDGFMTHDCQSSPNNTFTLPDKAAISDFQITIHYRDGGNQHQRQFQLAPDLVAEHTQEGAEIYRAAFGYYSSHFEQGNVLVSDTQLTLGHRTEYAFGKGSSSRWDPLTTVQICPLGGGGGIAACLVASGATVTRPADFALNGATVSMRYVENGLMQTRTFKVPPRSQAQVLIDGREQYRVALPEWSSLKSGGEWLRLEVDGRHVRVLHTESTVNLPFFGQWFDHPALSVTLCPLESNSKQECTTAQGDGTELPPGLELQQVRITFSYVDDGLWIIRTFTLPPEVQPEAP